MHLIFLVMLYWILIICVSVHEKRVKHIGLLAHLLESINQTNFILYAPPQLMIFMDSKCKHHLIHDFL